MEEEPLTTRGWALQERCLSRRTLHFTSSQIYFECERAFVAEDESMNIWTMAASDYFPAPSNNIAPSFGDLDWARLVNVYSKRKLTYEDDKLPAMAGLAALLFSRLAREGSYDSESEYYSGIWRRHFMEGICWSRDYRAPLGTRPQQYRAPTWSWASIDGIVLYERNKVDVDEQLATLEGVDQELEFAESKFGKVTSAWIHLKAFKFELFSEPAGLTACLEDEIHNIHVVWDAEEYQVPEMKCLPDQAKGEVRLFAVPIFWENSTDMAEFSSTPFFLVLKEVDHKVRRHRSIQGYERVGTGSCLLISKKVRPQDSGEYKQSILNKWIARKDERLESFLIL